jgi:hypothetical protein
MNRNKTAQLLNEWKSFLNESVKPKFSKDDIGKKVVVKDCCGGCSTKKEFKTLGIPSKEEAALKGVLEGLDGPNYGGQNIVFVKVSGEDKARHFPQCCVKKESGPK